VLEGSLAHPLIHLLGKMAQRVSVLSQAPQRDPPSYASVASMVVMAAGSVGDAVSDGIVACLPQSSRQRPAAAT
jgi:hypothetical protein